MLYNVFTDKMGYSPWTANNLVNNYSDEQMSNMGHDTPQNGGNGGVITGGSFTKMEPKTIALIVIGVAVIYKFIW